VVGAEADRGGAASSEDRERLRRDLREVTHRPISD
jgi:hypothetical protein